MFQAQPADFTREEFTNMVENVPLFKDFLQLRVIRVRVRVMVRVRVAVTARIRVRAFVQGVSTAQSIRIGCW